jgi:hypothetical protein
MLGDNIGAGEVMLRPNSLQHAGDWITTGHTFGCICVHMYVMYVMCVSV